MRVCAAYLARWLCHALDEAARTTEARRLTRRDVEDFFARAQTYVATVSELQTLLSLFLVDQTAATAAAKRLCPISRSTIQGAVASEQMRRATASGIAGLVHASAQGDVRFAIGQAQQLLPDPEIEVDLGIVGDEDPSTCVLRRSAKCDMAVTRIPPRRS